MTASAAQESKFEQFIKLPNSNELLMCCSLVAATAGLDPDERGTRWGVTVCASATSQVRLNVGNRVLLDARPDGEIEVFIVHPPGASADWADEVDIYNGFTQVENSIRLVVVGLDGLLSLLEYSDIPEKLQAHAASSGRALPKADWHNPLVDELLEMLDEIMEAEDDDDGDESDDDGEDEEFDAEDDAVAPVEEVPPIVQRDRATESVGPIAAGPATAPSSGSGELRVLELRTVKSTQTKPFDVPRGTEFFVVRWSGGDEDTSLCVNGVPPSSAEHYMEGSSGEFAIYEAGRYYLVVDSSRPVNVSVDIDVSASATRPSGVIASFAGRGQGNTRPFDIPRGTEYFIVRWSGSDENPYIFVRGIAPTDASGTFSGRRSGDGIVYGAGRFYVEVGIDGDWSIEVILE